MRERLSFAERMEAWERIMNTEKRRAKRRAKEEKRGLLGKGYVVLPDGSFKRYYKIGLKDLTPDGSEAISRLECTHLSGH